MRITYFFRPKQEGAHSIEILFKSIIENLPSYVDYKFFVCTKKWKRFHSFFKSTKYQSQINHITGDIHTIALFLSKKRTILTVHDIGRYDRDLKGLRKKIFKILWLDLPLRNVKFITTISDFTKNRLIEECHISEDKIHVIPNPASTDFKANQKSYNTIEPCILQIGSGNNKNIHRLINSVKDTNFKLLLIRKPSSDLEILLKEKEISYEWKYNLSRKEVYDCFVACDIVFFASEYEGFGVPILEANAVGRPVVTSNISSMPFVAGESAIQVNPFNEMEIKKALLDLHDNPNLREELINKGFENLQRFSIKTITEQYMDLYHKIALEQ